MKKQLLTILTCAISFIAVSQNSIPNGNFEGWNNTIVENPLSYPTTANMEAILRFNVAPNIVKTTDAYHGLYAMKMTTTLIASSNDTLEAYAVQTPNPNGDPQNWTGGLPYSETPTGIRGYYKYNVASGDTGVMLAVFKKNGVSIGVYPFMVGGVHTSYTMFEFPLNPPLPQAPDTIIFAAVASDVFSSRRIPGSELFLDSISFTGVASQPVNFNGDFELWTNTNVESPQNWSMDNGDMNSTVKTNDAAGGNFALELRTHQGDRNGVPTANAGFIGNGNFDNNCSCYTGGYPFSNMIDTLVFTYKYMPVVPTDSAFIGIGFKANGINVGWHGIYLTANPNYITVEEPISMGTTPDSAYIMIQSNQWKDTTLNHVGAILRIDEIHFKSQPIGLKESFFTNSKINFFPNPMKNAASISIGTDINIDNAILAIYDALGNELRKVDVNSHKISINKESLPSGVYIYKISGVGGTIKTGKFIIE